MLYNVRSFLCSDDINDVLKSRIACFLFLHTYILSTDWIKFRITLNMRTQKVLRLFILFIYSDVRPCDEALEFEQDQPPEEPQEGTCNSYKGPLHPAGGIAADVLQQHQGEFA